MQHQLYSRIVFEGSLEIESLLGRLNTKEAELATAVDRFDDFSLANKRVKAAQEDANKDFKETSIRQQRVLVEKEEFALDLEKKRAVIQRLQEEKETAISSFKGSEEYKEIHARHFLNGFWYGDSLAHKAHPD